VDRRAAIARAIDIARVDDTVVIAGKGHEDYQIIGRERLHFSDAEEALCALRRRGAAAAGSAGNRT
jgi:UDP-N-acetylmuramoyl-L-alanyl-D-glutamate--2,6-diaminopimelate ligase